MYDAEAIALVISYDGAHFAGFQTQPHSRTVQDRLEDALETVLGRRIRVSAAGRTDSGVHAAGQVVSFDATGEEPPLVSLTRSLNALAGPHIVVREARRARAGFSARHDALSRTYCYRLATGSVPPLFSASLSWWVKSDLDVEAMRQASRTLVGEHDFASFCVSESARLQPTTREVLSIDISQEQVLGEECLAITIAGRSFLHSMVRVIVGTLVEVGRARREPSWVGEVLAARDRSSAGPTAPPHGLVLERVTYDPAVWL